MSQPFFVTGALGCIGAWVVKQLVERGDQPVVFDLGEDRQRLEALLDADQLAKVDFIVGDVTDPDAVLRAVRASEARHIIHLAGLQVPTCRAQPVVGARVNVLGTLHVFEAARECGVERVVYASSAAVFGRLEDRDTVDENAPCEPETHYGVFKRANEGNARVYFMDHGVSSVGLRPLTVYGVGRDQGMTSDPTRAMKAAVVGRPLQIRFGGSTDVLYVADAAAAFVACADRAPEGAHVFNLHGDSVTIEHFVEVIRAALPPEARELVSFDGPEIPIAPNLDGSAVHEQVGDIPVTPLEDGVRDTVQRFQLLRDQQRLLLHDIEE